MKRILFVIDTLQTGGAEKSIIEIVSNFRTYKPIICTLFSKNSDLKQDLEEKNIQLAELSLTNKLWLIEGIPKLKKLVKELKPDIIHANLFRSELLTRLCFDGVKQKHIGSFVNDSYTKERYSIQSRKDNLKLEAYRIVDAITAKRVTHFTSLTNAIASSNARALHISPKKITTIYRGRNAANFQTKIPKIEDEPFIFLTVARLLKRKGYLELLKAASILKESWPGFKLLIAGEGPDKELFIDTAKKLSLKDQVDFLGTRNDIPDLLGKAHCFVFPSHYEGQGGALVEAMLAAKPIVATRIPVFEEQVQDGKSAILFNLFDEKDLASKMLWVYENYDVAVQMGQRAREVAGEEFDVCKIAEQHEQLYSHLLSKS